MSIPESLLDILCCPVSKEPLTVLDKSRLKIVNQGIAAGEVLYVDGATVETPLKAALVTRDNKVIYAVVDDIPVLLPDRGIGVTQFGDF